MKDSQSLVTIITNTKNRAGLISRCIESIQKQTYQNYEHIIVDGDTERYIKFHTHFLTEYAAVIEKHPSSGIEYYHNLMQYYLI